MSSLIVVQYYRKHNSAKTISKLFHKREIGTSENNFDLK